MAVCVPTFLLLDVFSNLMKSSEATIALTVDTPGFTLCQVSV